MVLNSARGGKDKKMKSPLKIYLWRAAFLLLAWLLLLACNLLALPTESATTPAAPSQPTGTATLASSQAVGTATPTGAPEGQTESTATPPAESTSYTGLFTIKGSWETHLDTTAYGGHSTLNQVANFIASGQPDNTMKGTVQVTTVATTEGTHCDFNWTSGILNWNAVLSGTFQKNSDGSLTVSLNPTPQEGPQYFDPLFAIGPGCGEGPRATRTVLPPNMGGTLVNGKFDIRKDVPGAAATGYHYVTGHIELVPNP